MRLSQFFTIIPLRNRSINFSCPVPAVYRKSTRASYLQRTYRKSTQHSNYSPTSMTPRIARSSPHVFAKGPTSTSNLASARPRRQQKFNSWGVIKVFPPPFPSSPIVRWSLVLGSSPRRGGSSLAARTLFKSRVNFIFAAIRHRVPTNYFSCGRRCLVSPKGRGRVCGADATVRTLPRRAKKRRVSVDSFLVEYPWCSLYAAEHCFASRRRAGRARSLGNRRLFHFRK